MEHPQVHVCAANFNKRNKCVHQQVGHPIADDKDTTKVTKHGFVAADGFNIDQF